MTADQLARKMLKRQDLVEKEFHSTVHGVAVSALAFCKMKLTEEIYALPEDLNRRGERRRAGAVARGVRFTPQRKDKKWTRTGHLRRSEKFDIRSPYEVAIVNTASYALPRHEAGKPGHRNINPARVSHWRDELAETFRPILLDLNHSTVEAILKAEGG